MSTYFLKRFAAYLLDNHPDDLSRVTVVLPTTRSRLFLMRHLHAIKGGAFWAPRCLILPDWVRSVLPGRVGGQLELMAAMFEQYKNIGGTENFDSFLGWQSVATRDFNDVDSALAPGKKVFSDLRNIREIENWDPEAWSYNRVPLSVTQDNFLRFWIQLGELYHAFSAWQDENACWSYSRAVRFLAENKDAIQMSVECDALYFVGIGSYSAAEKKLIRNVKELSKVEVVWDLDRYYYANSNHEAGLFARRWSETVEDRFLIDSIANHPIKASVIACGTSISQVMRAAEILSDLSEQELDNTCLVVNDESALEPLLSAITELKTEVNLAIGKPLQQTNLSRIAEELFVLRSLHLRKGKIYHKHFVQWLQVVRASGFEAAACDAIRQEILDGNLAQITMEQISKWSEVYSGLEVLFRTIASQLDSATAVGRLYEFFLQYTPDDEFAEVARTKMLEVTEELQTLIMRYEYMNNDALLLKIYQMVIGRMKMQYTGEPIAGLQLLSLSETRAVDFDRVIFLGSNEEYFPGERFEQSFIPFDLRNHYKLSMPEDADAIHSYTYYRLLHHAREVYFLYSTIVGDSKNAEPSRYITQMIAELQQVNAGLTLDEQVVGTTDSIGFREGVESSEFVRERLLTLFASGISPSAINKFVACPLDFYYRYIARLGEEKEVDESISSSKFGEIVHKVLEDFYKPFLGAYPAVSDLEMLKSNIRTRVFATAHDLYGGRDLNSGIDHLSMRIAIDMLLKYIDAEVDMLNEEAKMSKRRAVKFVEDTVSRTFETMMDGVPFSFSLRGKIDRADTVAGVLQVLDYKTGKIKSNNAKFNGNFDELFQNQKLSKFVQLLIYIMMTRDKQQPIPVATFYSMRENGGSFVHAQDLSAIEIDHDFMDKAEQALGRFLAGMLACSSYEHNSSAKYCEYCLVAHR
jgi:RecB family exonuclease